MDTFHEMNIFILRGDFKSALVLLKNRTESVARKILKKAGYSVPNIYGRSLWIYAQNTIMQAARNLSSVAGFTEYLRQYPVSCDAGPLDKPPPGFRVGGLSICSTSDFNALLSHALA